MLTNAILFVLGFYCLGEVFVVSLRLFTFNMFTQILNDTRKNCGLFSPVLVRKPKKISRPCSKHKNDVIFMWHGFLLNLSLMSSE